MPNGNRSKVTQLNDRPIRLEWVRADTLRANPRNWRRHGEGQLKAIRESLDGVGWAGVLLYNERTQRLIDGHGRLEVVAADAVVPVLVGSWTEQQENQILLTLDPISAMADFDAGSLVDLLADVDLDTPGLLECAAGLEKLLPSPEPPAADVHDGGQSPTTRYMIVVTCDGPGHQAELLERFVAEGLAAKPANG